MTLSSTTPRKPRKKGQAGERRRRRIMRRATERGAWKKVPVVEAIDQLSPKQPGGSRLQGDASLGERDRVEGRGFQYEYLACHMRREGDGRPHDKEGPPGGGRVFALPDKYDRPALPEEPAGPGQRVISRRAKKTGERGAAVKDAFPGGSLHILGTHSRGKNKPRNQASKNHKGPLTPDGL